MCTCMDVWMYACTYVSVYECMYAYHITPYPAISYYSIPHSIPSRIQCPALPCHTIPHLIRYPTISYYIIPYHTLQYHIIPYPAMSYHTITYPTIPHHTSRYIDSSVSPCLVPFLATIFQLPSS